ncbi:hypothetical protein ACO22_05567 [Paracoccidioides brasiliensis]|uniref:Transglycosylase SLT domain-containing protein n=1 Tax=Paracoccidioides brasiliensis TaxID=121759 RepID=A0A1D2JA15_PARBR|nr:hypothetical protein ACO22_05567 [Paracoccidioides brasiliensis]
MASLSLLSLSLLVLNLAAAVPTKIQDRYYPQSDGNPLQVGVALCYTGSQFPSIDQWLSFNELFELNKQIMLMFNSQEEVSVIRRSIEEAAEASGLDRYLSNFPDPSYISWRQQHRGPSTLRNKWKIELTTPLSLNNSRIILAVMMQESNGNVRTSAGDGVTPGIMQALGSPDCSGSAWGKCDPSTIRNMVMAGVFGTGRTEGLAACFKRYGHAYGPMLRCYNSGSVPDLSDLSKVKYGTPGYVSFVANRLEGFQPRRDCGFGAGIPSLGY